MEAEVDEMDVRVLQETLSKANSLSLQITASLAKVAHSGKQTERSIKPISGRTRLLTLQEHNLKSSLSVIDSINEYAKLSTDLGDLIQRGPQDEQLEHYVDSLDRLTTALQELQSSKLRSFIMVLGRIESLVQQGNTKLRDYLHDVLKAWYEPINAWDLAKRKKEIARITSPVLGKIQVLYGYFLKWDQHISAVDSTYVNCITDYLLRSMVTISQEAQEPKPTAGTRGYEKGSNAVCQYGPCVHLFLVSQASDLRDIFNGHPLVVNRYYKAICDNLLSEFANFILSLNDHVLNNMSTDSFLVFDLLVEVDNVRQVHENEWLNLGTGGQPVLPSQLLLAQQSLQKTSKTVLVQFLKYIETRAQQLQSVPSDHGTCDVTVDVITRLDRLSEHRQGGALLAIGSMVAGSWIPTPKPQWAATLTDVGNGDHLADKRYLLYRYFCDALDDLFINLESRAKALGKRSEQVGLLLLNNLAVVDLYKAESGLLKILNFGKSDNRDPRGSSTNLNGNRVDRLERLRRRALKLFMTDWEVCASKLMDSTVTGSRQLSSKDREAIKDRLRAFNAEFEGLVQRCKTYNLLNKETRLRASDEIKFITPLYERFYDKHIGGDFSKNVDKYLKYNKNEFRRIVDTVLK